MLTLMYITNNPITAIIAQKAGVDRIWVDLEFIGKEERQKNMNTVKSFHTVEDVKKIKSVLSISELLVRINPIHERYENYMDSKEEIDEVINAGANIIMLPMFKTLGEVKYFLDCVNGRVKTLLLLETSEAVEILDEILELDGIDEIHIGLNDLHLSYKKSFMFELLIDGTVKSICEKIKKKNIKYGFGGIARVGYGMLPSEYIIAEHYKLGSSAAILSRGFCDANIVKDPMEIETIFELGVKNIRLKEKEVSNFSEKEFEDNFNTINDKVKEIISLK